MSDENDNAPVFEEKTYIFTVAEADTDGANVNSQPSDIITSVGYVTAEDVDDGRNGTVSYKILNQNIGITTAILILPTTVKPALYGHSVERPPFICDKFSKLPFNMFSRYPFKRGCHL